MSGVVLFDRRDVLAWSALNPGGFVAVSTGAGGPYTVHSARCTEVWPGLASEAVVGADAESMFDGISAGGASRRSITLCSHCDSAALFTPTPSADESLKIYEMAVNDIEHENELTHQRLNSLLVVTGFLTAALGGWFQGFSQAVFIPGYRLFPLLVAAFGFRTAWISRRVIIAASDAADAYRVRMVRNFPGLRGGLWHLLPQAGRHWSEDEAYEFAAAHGAPKDPHVLDWSDDDGHDADRKWRSSLRNGPQTGIPHLVLAWWSALFVLAVGWSMEPTQWNQSMNFLEAWTEVELLSVWPFATDEALFEQALTTLAGGPICSLSLGPDSTPQQQECALP